MLNKTIDVKIGGGGRKFEPVPADKYTVQISDITEVESVSMYTNELETLLNFEFTILDNKPMETITADGNKEIEGLRGRRLWKRMRPVVSDGSKGKASWLYKLLCAVEKKTEPQEYFTAMAKNPDALVGSQLCVMVNQAPGKDGTIWNNILDFSKAEAELTPFEKSVQEEVSEKDLTF